MEDATPLQSGNQLAEPPAFGTVAWWDEFFRVGGGWEQKGGPRQTRVFAETFCRHVSFPPDRPFSLMDVGCGLGAAIKIFRTRYPQARLIGRDVARVAIERCRDRLGKVAEFEVGGIEELHTFVDVIYVSNVLEHFVDYEAKARYLVRHCHRLCIMVPFDERDRGQPLSPDASRHHQHTFSRDTFTFLVREGLAKSLTTHVVTCPGAWSYEQSRWLIERLKNPLRVLLGRSPAKNRYQIIYDIMK